MGSGNIGEGLLAAERQRGSVRQPSLAACICGFVLDLVFFMIMVALMPVNVVLFLTACCLPIFSWIVQQLLNPRREYLDGISAAFFNLVEESIIHGVFFSKKQVTSDVVFRHFTRTYLNDNISEFSRFKQRAVRSNVFWPYWTDTKHFNPAPHFIAVKEPVDKQELEKRLASIQLKLMNLERPLWELYHFEDYTDEDGNKCSASVLRVHHGMADGFTCLRMMMQGCRPNKPPQQTQARAERRPKIGAFQLFRFGIRALRKVALLLPDSASTYKASKHLEATESKVLTWSTLRSGSVQSLKDAGRQLGGASVNDLLIAAITGSLRKYAQTAPNKMPEAITSVMWVSSSPLKHIYSDFKEYPFKWGNGTLGSIYLKLGVGAKFADFSAVDTLDDVRQATSDIGLMVEAVVATSLLALFGWFPRCVGRGLWKALANKVSISMSNVPGPQFPLDWCGVPLRGMSFFVPPFGTVSIFVTICTFDGGVSVGMGADASLLDVEALRKITGELFEAEIRELQKPALGPV